MMMMNNVRSNNNMQKFKGVVPQQNGHWGAQIYANHQRIWLGTFKSEREAAMAYDSATIKLRRGESHRNFPWNHQTVQEPLFQSHYSTEAVLSMIRDGTYPSKFASFLFSTQTLTLTLNGVVDEQITTSARNNVKGEEKFSCTQLFQKELTPSDVGKLNRLVIPKKHASRYFPCFSEADNNNDNYGTMMDIDNSDTELVFYDKLMRSWKFRYCYWRSSQSFVFTRGWNRFVKDKRLKAKDVIAFYKCEPIINNNGGQVFYLVDAIYNNEDTNVNESSRTQSSGKMLSFDNIRTEEDEDDDYDDRDETEERKEMLPSPTDHVEPKGLKLFGVRLN